MPPDYLDIPFDAPIMSLQSVFDRFALHLVEVVAGEKPLFDKFRLRHGYKRRCYNGDGETGPKIPSNFRRGFWYNLNPEARFESYSDMGRGKMGRYDPISKYDIQIIEGWTVYVNEDLFAEGDLASKTLRELEFQLYKVGRALPEEALAQLRKVRIWVEAKSEVKCMCYHPSEQWLREHGFNPAKSKGVELGNPKNFLSWTLHQPWMVLHELAHAYHDLVLGWENTKVIAAYQQAKEEKLYESVLNYAGQRGKAYAMTDHKEYFAELSESYFGCNDWFPFVRAELREHDPAGYKMIEWAWGVA